MPCERAQQLEAYLDGELDAAAAAQVESHLETCGECRKAKVQIEALRTALREKATYHRADPQLRARIRANLDRETPRGRIVRFPGVRAMWAGAAGGATATALAASLAFFLLMPAAGDPLITDITNAHLRSLASEHLIDVVSTDRHTVKPWLAAHADLSPPVADFSKQGFKLIGGRVDFLEGVRSAVTVYRHGAHVVNVFAWADYQESLPDFATRNGYHIVFWKSGNLTFCAISDTSIDDILALSRLLKGLSQTDARE
ncbi:MAG TPA: anti-sigma factor [Rhizomicrobium sp.]|jgi:anti-sigma factor RsiW